MYALFFAHYNQTMRSRKNFKILPENVDNKLSTNRNKRKIGYAIKMKSYARTRHTTTIHKESRRLSFPPHNHLYLSTSTRFPDNIASTNTRQTQEQHTPDYRRYRLLLISEKHPNVECTLPYTHTNTTHISHSVGKMNRARIK